MNVFSFTGACPAPALPDRSRLFDQFWALNANDTFAIMLRTFFSNT